VNIPLWKTATVSNLPNLLTVLRLGLTPLVIFALGTSQWWLAAAIFCLAALTDALDGWLARRLNARSALGERLDPIADKALINAAVIGCAMAGLLPVWLAMLVAGRDLIILCGAALTQSLRLGHSLLPSWVGKVSTATQMVLIALALGSQAGLPLPEGILIVSIYLVASLTIGSGLAYGGRWLIHLRNDRLKAADR
jgi:cardiolipin synthase (CMP-forming)